MPWFAYRAARADGSIVSGSLPASSEGEARLALRGQDVFPLRLRETRGPRARGSVRRREVAVLFRSVASLVEVGVPVEKALGASATVVKGAMADAVEDIVGQLRTGLSLSEAMSMHDRAFPRATIGLIRAGERSSRLDESLVEAAHQLEEQTELTSEIRSALMYPAITLLMGVASVLVIGFVVIPRFAELLEQMDAPLPASVQVVMVLGGGLRRWWWTIPLAIGVLGPSAIRLASAPGRRRALDRALLKLPFLGTIRTDLASARVSRALGGMLSTGMPLSDALAAAEGAAGDMEIAGRLREVRERVVEGDSLSTAVRKTGAFPEDTLQLIAIGESSGQLPDLFLKAAEMKKSTARRAIQTAVKLAEPALVVGLGFMVASITVVLLKAMYAIRPGM